MTFVLFPHKAQHTVDRVTLVHIAGGRSSPLVHVRRRNLASKRSLEQIAFWPAGMVSCAPEKLACISARACIELVRSRWRLRNARAGSNQFDRTGPRCPPSTPDTAQRDLAMATDDQWTPCRSHVGRRAGSCFRSGHIFQEWSYSTIGYSSLPRGCQHDISSGLLL